MEFLPILAMLSILFTIHTSSAAESPTTFINESCHTTTYPSLCLKMLTPYAASVGTSPIKLCGAALSASIKTASSCSSAVNRISRQNGLSLPAALTIKDCIGNLKDSVYELKQTLTAMGGLRGSDRDFQWANAKTYASAAITDADTCIDGFVDLNVNLAVTSQIRRCVSNVEHSISNALYLINHLYS